MYALSNMKTIGRKDFSNNPHMFENNCHNSRMINTVSHHALGYDVISVKINRYRKCIHIYSTALIVQVINVKTPFSVYQKNKNT